MATRAAALLLVIAFAAPAPPKRFPPPVVPEHYALIFRVDLARARFDGPETFRVRVGAPSRSIVLNALDIEFHDVSIDGQKAAVATDAKKETATFTVPRPVEKGPAEIHVAYSGRLNDKLRGFYLSKANNRSYAVTQFEST